MHDFNYCVPTEIVFGKDSLDKLVWCIRHYEGHRILLVYGMQSAVKSGLIRHITEILDNAGIPHKEFGGAKPNPTYEHTKEGILAARKFGADMILAAGGGSAIDTAKAIALGAANPDDDIWDFWARKKEPLKALPVGVILTISAAGSESSDSAVLTNEALSRKRGLNSRLYTPKFAIMNPEFTYSLPVYQIACGITDIMMHTMDRYFNPLDNEVTDSIAEAILRTVILRGPEAITNPHDAVAMSDIMWAGSLSHNNLTGLGGLKDFAVHQLGHELSATFGTAHGASLATVWGSWASYVYKERPERFVRFAVNVWGIEKNSDEDDFDGIARKGIDKTVNFFKSIGMPTSFGENNDVGILSDDDIKGLAYRCTYERTRTIGTFKTLDEHDIYEIYRLSNK